MGASSAMTVEQRLRMGGNMAGRVNLEALPRIPDKDQGLTRRVEQTAEELKSKLISGGEVNLYQRGWLAQFDEVWGDGSLKATIFEEITKTTVTETQRRALDIAPPISPAAETQRYEGQRLDRVLGVIAEVQKESTRTVKAVLEEAKAEREEMHEERAEMREFVRQLFMDQRSLLELAFTQVKDAHATSQEAMNSLKEGIQAKGEAEAIGLAVQAQANATAQASQVQQNSVKDGIRGKLEDTLLMGLANKIGLPLDSMQRPPTTPTAPTAQAAPNK